MATQNLTRYKLDLGKRSNINPKPGGMEFSCDLNPIQRKLNIIRCIYTMLKSSTYVKDSGSYNFDTEKMLNGTYYK